MNIKERDIKQKKTVRKLLYAVAGMFAFSFALVPFYTLFCKVTGLNGKVDLTPSSHIISRHAANLLQSEERWITVEFDVTHNQNMPLEFEPQHKKLVVRPGVTNATSYYAKNPTNRTMTIQAIPSITPGTAARYLKKIECFCFQRQTLKPGESANMPIKFVLDSDMPKDIPRFTLSYTLFELKT
ncbi:MAG: cytochrome c oxidase assembly protein [Pedobacter sp.]|nr:cytochrome c oxidase assembly protein [Pedobacter sp.]